MRVLPCLLLCTPLLSCNAFDGATSIDDTLEDLRNDIGGDAATSLSRRLSRANESIAALAGPSGDASMATMETSLGRVSDQLESLRELLLGEFRALRSLLGTTNASILDLADSEGRASLASLETMVQRLEAAMTGRGGSVLDELSATKQSVEALAGQEQRTTLHDLSVEMSKISGHLVAIRENTDSLLWSKAEAADSSDSILQSVAEHSAGIEATTDEVDGLLGALSPWVPGGVILVLGVGALLLLGALFLRPARDEGREGGGMLTLATLFALLIAVVLVIDKRQTDVSRVEESLLVLLLLVPLLVERLLGGWSERRGKSEPKRAQPSLPANIALPVESALPATTPEADDGKRSP